jgi:hypothetical protein
MPGSPKPWANSIKSVCAHFNYCWVTYQPTRILKYVIFIIQSLNLVDIPRDMAYATVICELQCNLGLQI